MSAFNQIFLITGGSRGLGKGFASAIVQRGGKVIIVDIVKEVGEATEKELNETHPGQCLFYEGDVTDELLMRNIWEDSEKKLDAKIGVLVNNAGIFNAADWKKTMNINLISVMQMSYIALEKMNIKNGGSGGTIINVASLAGLVYAKLHEAIPYFVSKSAVVSFTKSLACSNVLENYGVKVAALCPTFSDTQMIKENTLVDMMKSSNMVPLTVEKVANDFIRLLEDIYNEKAKNGEIMCVCSKSKYVDENKFDLRELILPVSE
ncbi:15-hydroxyprostaglandin dehydrogenase [NAD(+)] isoform X1 [Hydra vulgaris]|uniref:15-hydroxyprostaglandin dehydrogenase [NAD(+)] isoform X1 n=1 Tax=Hydra vulgaris TaxID=6087 RepID=UPI001F5E888F|nr:15-hydroxyprostaglandin dehydrogenase [NAD(+)]-like [Hydra vulgaris]